MKNIIFVGAVAAISLTSSLAQAQIRGPQPGNCAVQAEMLADTIKQDGRITGTTESEIVETLGKFSKYMHSIVEAGMEETYRNSAAFGWDRATVDRKMIEGEKAIRDGFVGYGMESGKVYTDHLMQIMNCTEAAAKRGELGQADVAKMKSRLDPVALIVMKG